VSLVIGDDDEAAIDWVDRLAHAIPATGISVEEATILIVSSSSFLKISEILWSGGLDDLRQVGPRINLTSGLRPTAFRTPFHGCEVLALILLSATREQVRFQPHRKGTWLARIRFNIETDIGELGFTPIPLTPELRESKELNLPAGTMRYVVAVDPLDPNLIEEDVRVYVDIDLLAACTTYPGAPAARGLQHQIFLDVVAEILSEASRGLRDDDTVTLSDIDGSLIDRIIDRAGTVDGEKPDDELKQRYLDLVRDEPGKFLAYVEDWIPDLKGDILTSIARGV
jgi:hypothetical protein